MDTFRLWFIVSFRCRFFLFSFCVFFFFGMFIAAMFSLIFYLVLIFHTSLSALEFKLQNLLKHRYRHIHTLLTSLSLNSFLSLFPAHSIHSCITYTHTHTCTYIHKTPKSTYDNLGSWDLRTAKVSITWSFHEKYFRWNSLASNELKKIHRFRTKLREKNSFLFSHTKKKNSFSRSFYRFVCSVRSQYSKQLLWDAWVVRLPAYFKYDCSAVVVDMFRYFRIHTVKEVKKKHAYRLVSFFIQKKN